ncbi:hypothetical protein HIM_07065 [Hirsutella minnesotensis 3608]|uniref:Uncharacterized protein n=1 Tax=Hirsutella minnesotensis 3608 TaxID=1043627 RepID=A0A0F8A4F9_9HYPO|nr:hypothetical protein HIM_07065 [Hirsutella minnesotensis 3608]
MAHQAHNIPWSLLTAHLTPTFTHDKSGHYRSSSVHLKFDYRLNCKPNQAKDLSHFITAFAKNIEDHTRCERAKYPATYTPPSRGDLFLDDAVAEKIMPSVQRFRRELSHRMGFGNFTERREPQDTSGRPGILCPHVDGSQGFGCGCALPYTERIADAFLREYRQNGCYRLAGANGPAFFNVEVLKLLLLYGEMDLILRVCAHPDVDYLEWEENSSQWGVIAGWNKIYLAALKAYICLNICYCFPELWNPSCRPATYDYRSTTLFRNTVRDCTLSGFSTPVSAMPHRQFFDGWYHWYGYLPPDGSAIRLDAAQYASRVLREKGLPPELCYMILSYLNSGPPGRLPVSRDPLHPDNREELGKYLTYCWQLIVRCNMMAQALGKEIEWEEYICQVLIDQLSSKGGRKWYKNVTGFTGDTMSLF